MYSFQIKGDGTNIEHKKRREHINYKMGHWKTSRTSPATNIPGLYKNSTGNNEKTWNIIGHVSRMLGKAQLTSY